MPEGAPVAIPTLALGHFSHHALICFRSVVASLTPCSVRGCLPGCGQASPRAHAQFPFSARWSGNTRQPCAAQRRADAFPDLLCVIGFPNPIHQIQLRSKLARGEYGVRGEDFAACKTLFDAKNKGIGLSAEVVLRGRKDALGRIVQFAFDRKYRSCRRNKGERPRHPRQDASAISSS